MATFILVPGAGGSAWYWHRVLPLLVEAGHEAVSVDLPTSDDSAGLDDYGAVIESFVDARDDVVVVAQSMGALSAPLVCRDGAVELLVLVCPMIPRPGETGGEWWKESGQVEAEREYARRLGLPLDGELDPFVTFLHDVPAEVAAASADHNPPQSGRPFGDPWPLDRWPEVETRVIAGRHDRLFPLEFMQRLSRERLGIEPDVIDGGHLLALARPDELAATLLEYLGEVGLD